MIAGRQEAYQCGMGNSGDVTLWREEGKEEEEKAAVLIKFLSNFVVFYISIINTAAIIDINDCACYLLPHIEEELSKEKERGKR